MSDKQDSNLPVKPGQERSVDFIPFGSNDTIKLSAKMVEQFIAVPTKSGQLPDERSCIRFVMLCKAKRLNPFEGDAFLIGYDGQDGPNFSLITAHQAFLKRAESSEEYDGMLSGVTVEAAFIESADYSNVTIIRKQAGQICYEREGDFLFAEEQLLGAWAKVNFKNRKTPMFKRIKRSVFDTQRSRWKVDPAGMLVKCAEADALRSSFPTLLGGLYIEQEMERIKTVTDVTVSSPSTTVLNTLTNGRAGQLESGKGPEPVKVVTIDQVKEMLSIAWKKCENDDLRKAIKATKIDMVMPKDKAQKPTLPDNAKDADLYELLNQVCTITGLTPEALQPAADMKTLWEAATPEQRLEVKSATGAADVTLAAFEALTGDDRLKAVNLFTSQHAGKK